MMNDEGPESSAEQQLACSCGFCFFVFVSFCFGLFFALNLEFNATVKCHHLGCFSVTRVCLRVSE